ncbi:thymidine kinase [Anaerocolumna sp.]|uniref:thymidine kinase n=1 Tax=Anaerocolumna sp. TaxID=2041569 RepID=UPI0028AB9B49|nr:thymidine kinase [Anaerocolumna sp.]
MAKLYFKYGCMNSSKSANLLMIKYNYEEQGFRVVLLKPSLDDREGKSVIKSRIGIEAKCNLVNPESSIYNCYDADKTDVLMIDEAQFLTEKQVDELYNISFNIPVICFGLLTDFSQHLFEGSKRLIELAESIHEIKTVCQCGARANYNGRFDGEGNLITSGEQIVIGGNEKYKALCKKCYEGMRKQSLVKRRRQ